MYNFTNITFICIIH